MRRSLLLLSLALLNGCSITEQSSTSNQLEVEMSNAPEASIDSDIEHNSNTMYHYLVGQLAYAQQDFTTAIKNLGKASDLLTEPTPLVNSELAELYLRAGRIDDALGETKKALKAEPDNTSLVLLHCGLLEVKNRAAEAEPFYQRLIKSEPKRIEPYIQLAHFYSSQERHDRAVEVLREYTRQVPRDSLGFSFLGRELEMRGDLAAANEAFGKALQIENENVGLLVDRLRVALKAGKNSEAKALAQEIVGKDSSTMLSTQVIAPIAGSDDPDFKRALRDLDKVAELERTNPNVRLKMALYRVQHQNFKEAVRELLLVLAYEPDQAAARYYLASIYAGSGRPVDAVAELRKIDKDSEMFSRASTFAALILRQEGKASQAEEAIRDALKAEPDNRHMLSYLVMILRDEKKYEEAEKLLKTAIDRDPANDRLLFLLGLVLHDLNRDSESMAMMERVIKVNPRHSDALNFVAYGLIEEGGSEALDRALQLVTQALEIKPTDAYYLDTLGWLHYQRGEYEKAEEVLARAVNQMSEDAVILEHYGDALIKLGQYAKAVDTFRAAIESSRDANSQTDQDVLKRIRKKLAELQKNRPAGGIAARE